MVLVQKWVLSISISSAQCSKTYRALGNLVSVEGRVLGRTLESSGQRRVQAQRLLDRPRQQLELAEVVKLKVVLWVAWEGRGFSTLVVRGEV